MKFEDLKAKASEYKVKVGFFNKGLYKQLAENMPDDAEIEFMVEGFDKASANKVPVVVTTQKVYMASYNGAISLPSISSFKLDRVEGTEISGGIIKTVNINMSNGAYSVGNLSPQNAQALTNALA